MMRLQHGQVVTLAVGDKAVECNVAGIVGGAVALDPVVPMSSCELPAAGAGASIVFVHRGGLVQLIGSLHREGEGQGAELRFAVTRRPPSSEQRRRAARLELALPVTVTPLGEDGDPAHPPRQLVTFDVSLGGIGLRLSDGMYARGTLLGFALVPPAGEPLVGTARVAHVTGEVCGLQFEEVGALDRVRLAGYLVGAQRGRTRRAEAARAH
jgi:hypothetical protein